MGEIEQPLPPQPLPTTKNWWLKGIALYEAAGGCVGLWLVSSTRFTSAGIFPLLGGAFFLLGIAAGIFLWKGSEKGLKLSMIAQALQIIHLWSPVLTFALIAGPNVLISMAVVSDDFKIRFGEGISAMYFLFIGPMPQGQRTPFPWTSSDIVLDVNIVAIGLLAILVNCWKSKSTANLPHLPETSSAAPYPPVFSDAP